jgi:hypothetical protein
MPGMPIPPDAVQFNLQAEITARQVYAHAISGQNASHSRKWLTLRTWFVHLNSKADKAMACAASRNMAKSYLRSAGQSER